MLASFPVALKYDGNTVDHIKIFQSYVVVEM